MKIYYMVVLAGVLMVVFNLAGFDTTSSWIYTQLGGGDQSGFLGFPLWVNLLGAFGGIAITGAVIGALTRSSPMFSIKALFVMTPLTLLIFDFYSVLTLVEGWAKWVLMVMIIPIGAGYWVALWEFWEGRD